MSIQFAVPILVVQFAYDVVAIADNSVTIQVVGDVGTELGSPICEQLGLGFLLAAVRIAPPGRDLDRVVVEHVWGFGFGSKLGLVVVAELVNAGRKVSQLFERLGV